MLKTTKSENSHSSQKETIFYLLGKPSKKNHNKLNTIDFVVGASPHHSKIDSHSNIQQVEVFPNINSAIGNRYKVQYKNNRANLTEKGRLTTLGGGGGGIPPYTSKY